MRVELNPVFSIFLHLDRFHNIDLAHRGYYQVRFKLKSSSQCATDIRYEPASCQNVIYPPCVHQESGVSKTVEVVFAEESLSLDDCFQCSVHVPQRIDMLDSFPLHIVIELFFLDRDRPPRMESFSMISRRVLDIPLRMDRSLHAHRVLFFEYFAFSAVTLTVHASLVSVISHRKRLPPDSPVTDKLRNYHKILCQLALSTVHSLQRFMNRHSDVLSSPLNMEKLDIDLECHRYAEALNNTQKAWTSLEEDAARLSRFLSQLFAQLIQMFSRSVALSEILHAEFDLMRMKRLGEAFIYSEDTVQALLNDEGSQTVFRIAELLKRAPYFSHMPKSTLHCSGTDVDSNNITAIVERRFLPSCMSRRTSSENPPAVSSDHDGDSDDSSPLGTRLHPLIAGLCLPLNCTLPDEPYMRNAKETSVLTVGIGRLNARRMTDPGSTLKVSACENDSLLSPSSAREKKSKSTADFIVLNVNRKGEGNSSQKPQKDANITVPGSGTSSSGSSSGVMQCSNETDTVTAQACPTEDDGLNAFPVDERLIQFVHRKESFKQKLYSVGFRGYLYSDLAFFSSRYPYFSSKETWRAVSSESHLVVFVHGLEGGSEDLTPYRNFLRLLLPNSDLKFLLSESNQMETWADLNQLAENLLNEILSYMETCATPPKKISFVAHSMGGIITRCMVALPRANSLVPLLHTLLTLNCPHCGLLYNQRAANWGISLVQWWKQSVSLEQLCLRDTIAFRDSFLYRLSTNQAFAKFKYVLVVGSFNDLYVPHHSAVIEHCKAAHKDPSLQGTIYEEMVSNLLESIMSSPRHTTFVKYTAFHSLFKVPRSHQITGRAAHIAVVDDDIFIEKLLAVSAFKYFM